MNVVGHNLANITERRNIIAVLGFFIRYYADKDLGILYAKVGCPKISSYFHIKQNMTSRNH